MEKPSVIVSGRSEAGMLLTYIFASLGHPVKIVDKHAQRQTGAVYTLRPSTFNTLEAIATGLGVEVRKECRCFGTYSRGIPTADQVPKSGLQVGLSPIEYVISAERLHATLKAALNARPTLGSIEFVEGRLKPKLENDKPRWEVVQNKNGQAMTIDLLGPKTPLIVCSVEGDHGTTLELLGVEKAFITHVQYWIIGVVEGEHLGAQVNLTVKDVVLDCDPDERPIILKSSRLSDGRGRTAIQVQVTDEQASKLSQDSIDGLLKEAIASLSKSKLEDIQHWDIRGSNGLLGSKPGIIAVQGKAASRASFVHGKTVIAGFGDDISASSFQSGGGINAAIAETAAVAFKLATVLEHQTPEQAVKEANETLLNFADWFSYTGATMFLPEIDPRLVQIIYWNLLQQWHNGKSAPDFMDIQKKLDFLSQPNLVHLVAKQSLKFPSNGRFDLSPRG